MSGKTKPYICPECDENDITVIEEKTKSLYIVRTLRCDHCGAEWKTYEVAEEDFNTIQKAKRIIQFAKNCKRKGFLGISR